MRTVACVCALACASLAATAQSATAADRLPDLGMARLLDLRVEKTVDGRRLLRYSTVIVNVGHGRFEARQTSADSTQVAQRTYDDAGGYRDVATAATFVFGGDGHNHWHVRDLEISDLIRLDNGTKVGAGGKARVLLLRQLPVQPRATGRPPEPGIHGVRVLEPACDGAVDRPGTAEDHRLRTDRVNPREGGD